MISFPLRIFPYSSGVNDITKVVPSLPYDSSIPFLGYTANSLSDSGEKFATKGANYFDLFVNLKDILDVLCKSELIVIKSSTSGSVASTSMKYL